MTITIYHNPKCGTSRNTLAMIKQSGVEPKVIEYLETPPSLNDLKKMIADCGLTTKQVMRKKGTPFMELGLDDPNLSDDQLLAAMMEHPILINRPFVVTEKGTRLCRPCEIVLEILPNAEIGPFKTEDGQVVIDDEGKRVD